MIDEHDYVRLEPVKPAAVVEVACLVSSVCTFACSYCYPQLHDGAHRGLPIEPLHRFLDDVATRYPAHARLLTLEGGEPTVWPMLPSVLRSSKSQGWFNTVLSNGSRTPRWWAENAGLMDKVVLSYHPEFADRGGFAAIVETAAGITDVLVQVLAPPSCFDAMVQIVDDLRAAVPHAAYSLKPIRPLPNQTITYTEDQREMLVQYRRFGATNLPKTRKGRVQIPAPPSMVAIAADGTRTPFDARRAIAEGTNRWLGWNCAISTRLAITADGTISRGTCGVGGAIGSLHDTWTFDDNPVVCRSAKCPCVSEIYLAKSHPSV